MNLLIVESPSKAKTIKGYLGAGWEVVASYGHIRDLPEKEMGVEAPDFHPTYVISERSKPHVDKLKQLVKKAGVVYLAADPDREGEAIAWHVAQVTKPKNFKRVRFSEVTPTAIKKAIDTAGDIDVNLVKAQEARRVLDRLVGYKVSPVLTEIIGSATQLSSGRVQSVAVRLVVERERAIREFQSTEHFRIFAEFSVEGGDTWRAKWDHKPLLQRLGLAAQSGESEPATDDDTLPERFDDENNLWTNSAFAKQFAGALEKAHGFSVASIERKLAQRKPPAPFTTSTLQQAASVALKMSPDETMKAAQSLYESGFITYMRTDSPALSDGAIAMIRQWIGEQETAKGVRLLPDQPHKWAAKGSAQEAHEAVRPTDINLTAIAECSESEKQLYRLIWLRTVASQMKSAEFDVTRVLLLSDVAVQGERQPFLARGRLLLDAGWMALTKGDFTSDVEGGDQASDNDQTLPDLNEGDHLSATAINLDTASTKAPPRFTEATIVRALERESIGRPSTYAAILANIKKRQYIEIKARKVHATLLGEVVVDALVPHFRFMDYEFTRIMEGGLDKIAAGQAGYKSVVTYQNNELESSIAKARSADTPKPTLPAELSAEGFPCSVCDTGFLRRRKSRSGDFWSCSGFPTCTATAQDKKKKKGSSVIEPDMNTVRTKSETSAERILSEEDCPKCGKHKMVMRSGDYGVFWGCAGYPKCKTRVDDDNGKPLIEGAKA